MERATVHIRSGSWDSATAKDSVTLTFDDRYRRRIKLTTDKGREFLLELEEAVRLADGDGLGLAGGETIAVRAGEEDVLDITAGDGVLLARLAWHLGNRHTPVQVVDGGRLRIRYDHVLEAMIGKLGGRTERRRDIFDPEAGAYADHGHGH